MVEIEWDGVDFPARERRLLHDRLRGLSSAIDPDGRARLIIEIVTNPAGYAVSVTGSDHRRRVGVEIRDADLGIAIQRAMDLAGLRWGDARRRAGPALGRSGTRHRRSAAGTG